MESTKRPFPWPAPIIALLILVAMFVYAGFSQSYSAEESVNQFYKAYVNRDTQTMAKYVSVLWLYDSLPPSEPYRNFLEQRPEFEYLLTNNPAMFNNFIMPDADEGIKIMRDRTLGGDLAAFVVFEVQSPVFPYNYIATLVNEDNLFRLFQVIPAYDFILQQINLDLLSQLENDIIRLLDH